MSATLSFIILNKIHTKIRKPNLMDSSSSSHNKKPHALFIPFPMQSHIKCMLKLAKLYHNKGFHITFVNTHYNHNRLLKSRGLNVLDGSPDFQFKSIPDGLSPCEDIDAQQDLGAIVYSLKENNFLAPFIDLVKELNQNEDEVPLVTTIVADGFMFFTLTAAKQLGVPIFFFFTIAACCFMLVNQFRDLRDKGIAPPNDKDYLTNGYMDTIIDWVSGMKDIRLRDFPSFVHSSGLFYDYMVELVELAKEASGVILHTFDALEKDILDAMSSFLPRLYTIGPLQLLLNNMKEDPLKSMGYSLWKEDEECLRWLDTKEHNSVVYVSFGSTTIMTNQQLVEFAMGLANSGHPFLWIIRPDLVVGESMMLPQEFIEAAKERGMILGWCSQEEVLNHPSVGGFLTHCGWGSMIESLSAGVPMICWPFFGDQQTNCRFACVEWGVGIEMDNNVKRDEVEKLVKELMDGENGKKLKSKAAEWKAFARVATSHNGSSTLNFEKLINLR